MHQQLLILLLALLAAVSVSSATGDVSTIKKVFRAGALPSDGSTTCHCTVTSSASKHRTTTTDPGSAPQHVFQSSIYCPPSCCDWVVHVAPTSHSVLLSTCSSAPTPLKAFWQPKSDAIANYDFPFGANCSQRKVPQAQVSGSTGRLLELTCLGFAPSEGFLLTASLQHASTTPFVDRFQVDLRSGSVRMAGVPLWVIFVAGALVFLLIYVTFVRTIVCRSSQGITKGKPGTILRSPRSEIKHQQTQRKKVTFYKVTRAEEDFLPSEDETTTVISDDPRASIHIYGAVDTTDGTSTTSLLATSTNADYVQV